MAGDPEFLAPIAEEIWRSKYKLGSSGDRVSDTTLADTFHRVARAAATIERSKRAKAEWSGRFYDAMADFSFLPGGRILAGGGSGREVTLFNCFVMGRIEDDLGSIFEHVREAALTMQLGGGIGHDFSTLRPKGAVVKSIGADASGPVSFMDVWDAMCRTIMSAGARRGAMMGTLHCAHPDIELFIDAKSDPQRLRNFNVSVLVTDAFMEAVKTDAAWDLVFEGKVYRTVQARALWERIMRAAYDYAEPGVIFIDRVNARNNLSYCEEIRATNPCGEQPLPPYGACLLGSINLAQLVLKPFTAEATVDVGRLEERVRTAVRFLDNVIDISNYPLPQQKQEAKAKRRIGLGVTGLADALIFCGVRYGSEKAQRLAETWMGTVERAAYLASVELAQERGAFPLFDRERFLAAPHVAGLPQDARDAIEKHGIRNGCLTTIAPAGTISLLAGNVSSGVEPVFDLSYSRRVLGRNGVTREEQVEDFAHSVYRRDFGASQQLTPAFVTTAELSPRDHLVMQAALQRHVDSSISKTINVPADISFEAFKDVYLQAFELGLKGCTAYRPNAITGAVLTSSQASARIVAASSAEPIIEEPDEPPFNVTVAQAEPRHAATSRHSDLPPGRLVDPALSRPGDVVYMSKPLEREPVLPGFTYKIKWPESDHALYITINDIEWDAGGGAPRRRPFEIFINTRNLEHYAWTVALTRMISAVFRRGGDVSFVAEELKAVFDPQGGRWIGGKYVPSLLAAIGEVIERHMVRIGFLAGAMAEIARGERAASVGSADAEPGQASMSGERAHPVGRHCPRCSSRSFVMEEGCWVCRNCGYSRCE